MSSRSTQHRPSFTQFDLLLQVLNEFGDILLLGFLLVRERLVPCRFNAEGALMQELFENQKVVKIISECVEDILIVGIIEELFNFFHISLYLVESFNVLKFCILETSSEVLDSLLNSRVLTVLGV